MSLYKSVFFAEKQHASGSFRTSQVRDENKFKEVQEMLRTYQPKKRQRKKEHGFRKRMASLGKSYLENCLARRSSKHARFSFGQPRSGVRGKAYHKPRFTSSVFLRKSFQNFVLPALSAPISCRLERKKLFLSTA